MRRRLSVALTSVIAFSSMQNPVSADTMNPPRLTSVKIANMKPKFQSGDEIIFEVNYTGGDPGLSFVGISIPWGNSRCVPSAYWNESVSNTYPSKDFGLTPNSIRLFSFVTNDCLKGANKFSGSITLKDKTELRYDDPNLLFEINVSDGLFIPPGEALPPKQEISLNLNSIPNTYTIDVSKPTIVELPTRSAEGLLLDYASKGPACTMLNDAPGLPFTKMSLQREGDCEISVNTVPLSRTYYSIKGIFSKRITIVSKTNLDKAASVKKPSTITCIKGKLTKKITTSNPKCPAGYKKK